MKSHCLDVKNADCIRKDINDTSCHCKKGFYPVRNESQLLECVEEHCDQDPCPPGHTCEGKGTLTKIVIICSSSG